MGKILKIPSALKQIKSLKSEGKKIVLAGGCFDILHLGHIKFLENSKKQGDVLVLFLESDEIIKRTKGKNRPVNSLKNRAQVLSSINPVDIVIPLGKQFTDKEYNDLVFKISPDVIAVTKGDPNIKQKQLQAREVNGVVKVVINKLPEYSTTKIWKILNEL